MATPAYRPPSDTPDQRLDRMEQGIAEIKGDIVEIKGAILKLVDVASRTREDLAEIRGQLKFMATTADLAEVKEQIRNMATTADLAEIKGQLKSIPNLWQLVTAMLAINSGIVGVAALAVTLFRQVLQAGP